MNKKSKDVLERFDRQQIVESSKYSNRKDILNVLLDENKQYSLDETDEILNKFLNGMVN